MLRTSGFQARPNSIEARQARCCYTELVFRRELEGNCIDILLLACLHKLYIWHGGGQTTIKPKDITDNVHSCQMFQHVRKNPGSLYWRDGLGSPAKPALKPLVVVLPIEFAAVSLWTKITFSFNQPELKTNMIQTVIIIQDSIYT